MVGPEPSKLMMPVRSLPCQPVSWGCRSAARTPVSKTGNVGAIPAVLAILLRWQNSYAPACKAG